MFATKLRTEARNFKRRTRCEEGFDHELELNR